MTAGRRSRVNGAEESVKNQLSRSKMDEIDDSRRSPWREVSRKRVEGWLWRRRRGGSLGELEVQ